MLSNRPDAGGLGEGGGARAADRLRRPPAVRRRPRRLRGGDAGAARRERRRDRLPRRLHAGADAGLHRAVAGADAQHPPVDPAAFHRPRHPCALPRGRHGGARLHRARGHARARFRADPRAGGAGGRGRRHARDAWRRGCCRSSTGSIRRCCAASRAATAASWRSSREPAGLEPAEPRSALGRELHPGRHPLGGGADRARSRRRLPAAAGERGAAALRRLLGSGAWRSRTATGANATATRRRPCARASRR